MSGSGGSGGEEVNWRPEVRRPLYRPPLQLRPGPPAQLSGLASSAPVAVKDPEIEFGPMLKEAGFTMEYVSLGDLAKELEERADRRLLELRAPDSDRSFFVGEEVGRLLHGLKLGSRASALRQHLDCGSHSDLGNLLACLHPLHARQRPSRLRVEELCAVLPIGSALGLSEVAAAMGRFYVCESLAVTVGEKLLLAAGTGSEEILESVLSKQAGKKEAIEEIVEDKPLYDRIAKAPHGARVMQRMLEHMAKCHQKAYQDSSSARVREMRKALLRPCQDLLDFSAPDRWRSASATAHKSDAFQMRLGGESFYPSKWWMAAWSPVLDRLLFGGFREGRTELPSVSIDEGGGASEIGREGLVRFLSLLHPSPLCFLWFLLPDEHLGPQPSKSLFLQDLWELVFRSDLDLAFEVFRLAHKFEVTGLMELCVVLMEVNSGMSLGERIMLADAYYLPSLLARCLAQTNSARALKRVFEDESLNLHQRLSCPAHSLLFRHLLKIV